MKKIYAFLRHNSCLFSTCLISMVLTFYAVSCQSTVISLSQPGLKITRSELILEVDTLLATAASRFDDLDRQDLVRDTIFNSVLDLAQGKAISPIGIAITVAGILGIGAVGDNIRKRTHINTLKGDSLNVKVHAELKKILHPSPN